MSDPRELTAAEVWAWLGAPATTREALDRFFERVVVPMDPARFPPPGTPVVVRDFLARLDVAPVRAHRLGVVGLPLLVVERPGTGPDGLTADAGLRAVSTWRPLACWRRLTATTEELVVAADAERAFRLALADAVARGRADGPLEYARAPFVRVPDDEPVAVWNAEIPARGACPCLGMAREVLPVLPADGHHPGCPRARPSKTARAWADGGERVLFRGPLIGADAEGGA